MWTSQRHCGTARACGMTRMAHPTANAPQGRPHAHGSIPLKLVVLFVVVFHVAAPSWFGPGAGLASASPYAVSAYVDRSARDAAGLVSALADLNAVVDVTTGQAGRLTLVAGTGYDLSQGGGTLPLAVNVPLEIVGAGAGDTLLTCGGSAAAGAFVVSAGGFVLQVTRGRFGQITVRYGVVGGGPGSA